MTATDAAAREQVDELGPIDYVVVEWPGRQPTGEARDELIDLDHRGIIRILDLAFIAQGRGRAGRRRSRWPTRAPAEAFAAFAGASSGVLWSEDASAAGLGAGAGDVRGRAGLGESLGRARRGRHAPVAADSWSPADASQSRRAGGARRASRTSRAEPGGDTMPGLLRGVAGRRRHCGDRDLCEQPRLTAPSQPVGGPGGPAVPAGAVTSSAWPSNHRAGAILDMGLPGLICGNSIEIYASRIGAKPP